MELEETTVVETQSPLATAVKVGAALAIIGAGIFGVTRLRRETPNEDGVIDVHEVVTES